MAHNIRKNQKQKFKINLLFFWNFGPKTCFPRSPNQAASFGILRAHFSDMFIFSSFVPPDKNQQKYAETATCFRSLGENSPEDPAQVKERPT